MKIRVKTILFTTMIGFVVGVFGLMGMRYFLPKDLEAGALASGLAEGIVTLAGIMLTLASAMLMLRLEAAHQDREQKRRLLDAHKRLDDEIRENITSAAALLTNPHIMETTVFPDDVWTVARPIIYDYHTDADDPVDYALTNFYKRVKLMQLNDSKRLDYLLAGGTNGIAKTLVMRDCAAIIEIGQSLVGLDPDLQAQIDECKATEAVNEGADHANAE